MAAKRLPATDEERVKVLQAIMDQEELLPKEETILPVRTLHEMRNLTLTFEGSSFCFKQAMDDENRADKQYIDLFKNAQLYISHFIQVLNLCIIRNEIKPSSLLHYGLEETDGFTLPDLSSEETLLEWGDKVIKGETERTYNGGAPIYNPAIAKVKVHYDLFKESLYSLSIYRKNTIRCEANLSELRDKVDQIIWDVWCQIEDRFWDLPDDARKKKFKDYRINFYYQAGEQLSVFG
ncbi:hypothetical protein LJB98_02580 [Bacteroidales bacterium OttesenSCG-928-M11]|nr:hypothetical protein [Bacteroidales bacterium OttesenSCG-928-M11]